MSKSALLEAVALRAGIQVIKSPARDETGFIVVPTTKIAGIESVSAGDEHRLWRAAWDERGLLELASNRKLTWRDIVLAVNSKSTRSQDQLHIHLGCINSSLRDLLAAEPSSSATGWQLMRLNSLGASFFVKLLPEQAITTDLAKMAYDEIPGGMMWAEKQTIAIAGVMRGEWRGFALMVSLEATAAEMFLGRKC